MTRILVIIFFSIFIIKIVGFYRTTSFRLDSNLNFGFTPEYTNIAKSTFEQKYFSKEFSNGYKDKEMRREPLYPILLMTSGYVLGNFNILITLQIILLLTTLSIWAFFTFKKFGILSLILFSTLIALSSIPFFYSLVFYPYIINVFFITLGLLLLTKGLKESRESFLIISGVSFALASYERGIYLLFPFMISAILILTSHYNFIEIKIEFKKILFFLLPFLIIVAPWIVRNSMNGVYGMNGMNGYSLGYTYGSLNSSSAGASESTEYNKLITLYGSDAGTSYFIDQEILINKSSFAEADKKVTSIVIDKIRENPLATMKIIYNNILMYPSRLAPNLFFSKNNSVKNIFEFYVNYASRSIPSVLDYAIIIFAAIGIIYEIFNKNIFSIIALSILIYLFLAHTLLVTFDPRYRGVSDLIIYSYVFIGISLVYKFIMKKQAY